MRIRFAAYALILVAMAALAEYPSGYFYAIYDGDTFCVKPVITDSVIESAWFDYASASLHTGLEVPFESHYLFFYNPLTGNIGFLMQHNIDEIGTADATCQLYLDDLPAGCTLAISDDPSEFQLGRYPQGQWHWWYNTDGGAFFIPRDEWQFGLRAFYGSSDPIRVLYFVSGDYGGDRIFLDSVVVGDEYDITVGHGFLQLIPYPDDSITIDCTPLYEDTTFEISFRNSGETVDTLRLSGASHTNPLFSTVSYYPSVIPPSRSGGIVVHFSGGGPGLYVDTVWAVTNEPCGTNPIMLYLRVLPPAIGHLVVEGVAGLHYLRVVDSIYAEEAANGVIMVTLPDAVGAADLVDTTDASASPVWVRTPYGIRAWRDESECGFH
ncbi:hypothetical protein J7L01_06735 [bacterium]|nr:hypothetical protein [bacterium]